ncbi:hypothetical protein GJAV_G00165110 [Gymnothorax javanicus]|nr:hypothetical protein GJAV_G00165110 [Gymnothorax javanicus]
MTSEATAFIHTSTPLKNISHLSSTTEDAKSASRPSVPTKQIVFFTQKLRFITTYPIQFQYAVVTRETISAISTANSTESALVRSGRSSGDDPMHAQSPFAVETGANVGPEGTLELQMHISGVFHPAYLDPNTPEHQELARNVTEEVSPVFKMRYPKTFVRCKVDGFWNGPLVVNMTLIFKSQEVVPDSAAVVNDLSEALRSGLLHLAVIEGSVIVGEKSKARVPAPEESHLQTSQSLNLMDRPEAT